MSETGTFVFARIVIANGSETWRRFQFLEDQQEAAQQAVSMLRREDVRDVVTVAAEDLTYWSHETVVTAL